MGTVAAVRPGRPLGETQCARGGQVRSARRRSRPAERTAPALWGKLFRAAVVGQEAAQFGTNVEDPAMIDEFAACAIESKQDLRDRFVPSFYFGCEADDPVTAAAFDATRNPFGARLNAVFGSDIGHFDVPDMSAVAAEAYELVEHGLITEDDFRDFVFVNPARLWTAVNPDFFKGTAVASAVASLASQKAA